MNYIFVQKDLGIMGKIILDGRALLVLSLISAAFSPYFLDRVYLSFFYGASLLIKDILVSFLPIVIVGSVYRSITGISGFSSWIIPLLVISVFCLNFFNVVLSYSVGSFFAADPSADISPIQKDSLLPAFSFNIPKITSNDIALATGFALGFLGLKKPSGILSFSMDFIYRLGDAILKKLFLPILPLFLFGFVAKASFDGIFYSLATNIKFFYIGFALLSSYLSILYLSAGGWNFKRTFAILKNVAPALATAFATMSSAACLPFSLKASALNCRSEKISSFYISSTVNIHMLGDAIFIPILAILVMNSLGLEPPPGALFSFAAAFAFTKFSGAGVPGGTILIMSPVLENTLGFTKEAIGLITTLYIIIDPITTSGSVLGNNGFVIAFEKFISLFRSKKIEGSENGFLPKIN